MKLFFSPGACSLAAHIVLRESALPFTLEQVDTATHLTASGADYTSINPKGQVPLLLLEDDTVLTEGPVIAQFVADQAGALTLMPAPGTLARYRVMEWQNYIGSELHKSFTPLFNPGFDGAARRLHMSLLRKKLEWVDSQLATRDYLTGADFTAADAYLFAVTGWAGHVDLNLADLASLQRFRTRVAARPAVREALRAEGLAQ